MIASYAERAADEKWIDTTLMNDVFVVIVVSLSKTLDQPGTAFFGHERHSRTCTVECCMELRQATLGIDEHCLTLVTDTTDPVRALLCS